MADAKNLWGGRFTKAADQRFAQFNRSFGFDRRLLSADLEASTAHCEGLRRAEILNDEEARRIQNALRDIGERSGEAAYR
ncbi:MAG: hypothetical protein WKF84_03390 [Pyrinomonadaceae bacterium]